MKIALNGWQRLWVMFSVILLAFLIIAAIMLSPSPTDISHDDSFIEKLSTTSKAKLAPEDDKGIIWDDVVGLKVKMPNEYVLCFAKGIKESDAEVVSAEYYSILRKIAYIKKFKFVSFAFAIWLGTIGVMYAFGWSIGWVYQGFKEKKP
jgi:hypothetical protein